jgi:hypothetical protein
VKYSGIAAFVIAILAIGYVSSPFVTAWRIREAVRNGNSDYLATAIEWESVRATLKPSIARIALGLPETAADASANPGLWTRFKAYWGQGMVERAVEGYVTPEGLPQLFSLRKAYRSYVSNADDEASTLPLPERIGKAWARVKRAEFKSVTRFEIDMEDKLDPTRVYLGTLELFPAGWKLTELRVRFLATAEGGAQTSMGVDRHAM